MSSSLPPQVLLPLLLLRLLLLLDGEFLRRSRGSSRTRARRGSRTCKKSKEERARKSELSRERFLERGKSGEKSFFSFFLELQASETSSINLLFRQSFVHLLLLFLRFPSFTMISGTPHARAAHHACPGSSGSTASTSSSRPVVAAARTQRKSVAAAASAAASAAAAGVASRCDSFRATATSQQLPPFSISSHGALLDATRNRALQGSEKNMRRGTANAISIRR